jgi:hypothetical protein
MVRVMSNSLLRPDDCQRFLHDLNNDLLAVRAHATLALMALEDGVDRDVPAELRGLLDVVDHVTTVSRDLQQIFRAA